MSGEKIRIEETGNFNISMVFFDLKKFGLEMSSLTQHCAL